MKIQMQAILSQAEIEEAIREYVRQQAPMTVDQDGITVVFEDETGDSLTAIVTIGDLPAIEDKPKTTKPRANKKPATATTTTPAEDKPADTAADPVIVDELVAGAETTDQEGPPFDVDTPTEATTQVETQTVAEEKPTGVAGIFASASTSAPTPKVDEPVVAAKSLFANLVKPTNVN